MSRQRLQGQGRKERNEEISSGGGSSVKISRYYMNHYLIYIFFLTQKTSTSFLLHLEIPCLRTHEWAAFLSDREGLCRLGKDVLTRSSKLRPTEAQAFPSSASTQVSPSVPLWLSRALCVPTPESEPEQDPLALHAHSAPDTLADPSPKASDFARAMQPRSGRVPGHPMLPNRVSKHDGSCRC